MQYHPACCAYMFALCLNAELNSGRRTVQAHGDEDYHSSINRTITTDQRCIGRVRLAEPTSQQ